MNALTRRNFLEGALSGTIAVGVLGAAATRSGAVEGQKRKMTMDLVCGNIGVSASQLEALALAAKYGFESVGADGGYLSTISADQLAELKGTMKSKVLVFGAAGLPVDFRQDSDRFDAGMKALRKNSRWTTAANCPAPRG